MGILFRKRFNSLSPAPFFNIRAPFESVLDREKPQVSFLEYIAALLRNGTFTDQATVEKNRYFCVDSTVRFLSSTAAKKGRRLH